ncbi:hypothetical protein COCCADRAFT_93209, partial [Bipolaris zeicola 26-R-13]
SFFLVSLSGGAYEIRMYILIPTLHVDGELRMMKEEGGSVVCSLFLLLFPCFVSSLESLDGAGCTSRILKI